MIPKNHIHKIFNLFEQNNPAPTTELQYQTTFELLVSVILSAQATDISVNKATKVLFNIANTPPTIISLGETRLKKYIKNIGLYNSKAKNIISTCKLLAAKYHNEVPKTREELESLPGVGRKTANVILNTAFNQPTIAVDTHIFRVANRLGLTKGKTVQEVEKQLLAIIPKKYHYNAHHWLILHGRYICKARKPLCFTCFISKYCQYPNKIQQNN